MKLIVNSRGKHFHLSSSHLTFSLLESSGLSGTLCYRGGVAMDDQSINHERSQASSSPPNNPEVKVDTIVRLQQEYDAQSDKEEVNDSFLSSIANQTLLHFFILEIHL